MSPSGSSEVSPKKGQLGGKMEGFDIAPTGRGPDPFLHIFQRG